ncbi:hypothetical protein D3C85_1548040 [compost metagenome]
MEQGLTRLGRHRLTGAGHVLQFMTLQVGADAQGPRPAVGAGVDVFQTNLAGIGGGFGQGGVAGGHGRLQHSAAA